MSEWTENDLRIGCRLLPDRDDDILNFFSKVGKHEKSYKIREAIRIYVQLCGGDPKKPPTSPLLGTLAATSVAAATPVAMVPINQSPISFGRSEPHDIMPESFIKLDAESGGEPSDEDVLSALKSLGNMF